MKSSKTIVLMAVNELKALHELYEGLIAREYDFNEMVADACHEMYNDIITVVHAVKKPEVDFDMGKHVKQFANLMYKIHSILMIERLLNDEDTREMISGIEKQLVKRIDQLIEEYSA